MNHSRLRWALLLVAAVTLLAACASTPPVAADQPTITPNPAPATPPPATAPPAAPPEAQQQVEVTFYAAADNDPPGTSDIAYPNTRHSAAGGSGTYQDPLTLASDPREIRPGVLAYYPALQKYFVMEDDCAPCIDQWNATRTPHVDLWIPAPPDSAVQTCEATLTPDDRGVLEINPPPGLPIDPRPLYDTAGHCWPNT